MWHQIPPAFNPPPKRRHGFWTGVLTGFLAAVLVTGLSVGAYALANRETQPSTFTIEGSLTLSDSVTTYGLPSEFDCAGDDGYDDIGPNSSVTVSDQAGDVIATGQVQGSSGGASTCTLTFSASDVPEGRDFYKVEISHRGELTFTEEEAKAGITMTLGD